MRYIKLIKADEVDKRKGFNDGDVFKIDKLNESYGYVVVNKNHRLYLNQVEFILINRYTLQQLIKLNQIKATLVSKYLGHSPSWLTTMANEKRRGDLSDESLKAILKKLHIDWSSNEFINVKATKEHTAYRTRPCTYTTEMHKERLQKAMWSGLLVK